VKRRVRDDEALIVELFARPRGRYDEPTALRLSRATAAQLRAAIAEGTIEPVEESGMRTLSWAEVVQLAQARWTPRMISAALARAGVEHTLPYLNRTRAIRVELPLYQIRMLHWLAMQAGEPGKPPRNASDILEQELDGVAAGLDGVEAIKAAMAIPGFVAAVHFPHAEDVAAATQEWCIYCGSEPATSRGACAACGRLHRHWRR